ncbi:hypothetical protein WMF31_21000 [Sorangium sp. So ce1036]|uniref:hypothetical protein n=1 Tax=Sorangium sp. So ce1036 TaxID=3133328 RepID=UPI003EFE11A9
MGVLALSIVWVNTLLIVAAALKQRAAVAALLRRLGPSRQGRGAAQEGGEALLSARVLRGDGQGGALAAHRIDQVGRAGAEAGAREAIAFADRGHAGEIHGGVVVSEGREIAIEPVAAGEVWVSPAEVRAASACPSDARFDEAYQHARRPRGFSRTVEVTIRAGTPVWLLGAAARGADGALRMRPSLVSSVDPRAWCRSRCALLSLGVAGIVGALLGCTALALSEPRFGPLSAVGGALCLAFFLLVQPLGTALRDAARTPAAALARGRWLRPRAAEAPRAVASR